MARECVGDTAYDSFNEKRAASIKRRLLHLATDPNVRKNTASLWVERSIHFAEIIAIEEKADLHIVLAGAALSIVFKERLDLARKELLKLGFQLEDADEVCRIIEAEETTGDDSVNRAVVHDAVLLARKEISGPGVEAKARCLTAAGSKFAD
jgi:hypothetical protein